jgi:hypothetical protein
MTPLPEITPKLEKYQRISTKKYPKPPKNPKIKKLRITTKPSFSHGNNLDIYPEYQFKNKWYVFQQENKFIIFTTLRHTINGISLGTSNLGKIKKEIKKWLKDWMKENNILWDKSGGSDEKVEEQTWETSTTKTTISEIKLKESKINVVPTKKFPLDYKT